MLIRRLPRHLPILLMIALMITGLLRQLLCAERLAGIVDQVPDGQTLFIGVTRIRLHTFVVAPPRTEAGEAAQRLLQDFALGQEVTCRICRRGRAGNAATGTCQLADGTRLGRALVSAGLARDCPAISGGTLAGYETAASKKISLPTYCRPSMRRGPMPPVR
jgi:endonuclease YncB( thermonuclease family)